MTDSSTSEAGAARQPSVDWGALSTAQRIKHLEIEGYVLIPAVLSPEQVRAVTAELDRLPTTAVDYSENQRYYPNVHWTDSPRTIDVIAQPSMVEFLTILFGD